MIKACISPVLKNVRPHRSLLANSCMWAFSSMCFTARHPRKTARLKNLRTLYSHLKPPCLSIAKDNSCCESLRQCPVPCAEWHPPRERHALDLNLIFNTAGYHFLCSIYKVFQDVSLEGAIPEKYVLWAVLFLFDMSDTDHDNCCKEMALTCRKAHRHVPGGDRWEMVLTAVFCGQWVIPH